MLARLQAAAALAVDHSGVALGQRKRPHPDVAGPNSTRGDRGICGVPDVRDHTTVHFHTPTSQYVAGFSAGSNGNPYQRYEVPPDAC
jgi:hypothetical protein